MVSASSKNNLQFASPARLCGSCNPLARGLVILVLLTCPAASFGAQAVDDNSLALAAVKQPGVMRVFGDDERQPVTDTSQFPWSAVGLVESRWHKADLTVISRATGTLVGNRVVLTGGHCIYDQEDGWADEVLFIPGKNGESEPFGRAASIRNIAQRAWVEQKENRYDLALIVLSKPLGEQAGYMPIAVEPSSFFVNRNLNSSGYPGEVLPGDVQYHAFGASLDLQGGLIRHRLDSEPGQSGSPLWYYDPASQNRRVVGVLTGTREVISGGELVDAYNVAVHIDSTFATWIQQTLSEYDTVAQQVVEGDSSPVVQPASCGTGVPAAAFTLLLLLGLRSLVARL